MIWKETNGNNLKYKSHKMIEISAEYVNRKHNGKSWDIAGLYHDESA